ncbi:hypothetical protein EJ06DRAFT_191993 [Trichodelitschia bisporula]|uniref:Uncharacterized protein n=1 Tax=Trichodelitschia bisporula TaxID=703511 RepID=A0A6G1I7Q6_9PEZI|nr:hypothetical protein EJ06DRAFT_191993 [Trichodelitschia bisporula]
MVSPAASGPLLLLPPSLPCRGGAGALEPGLATVQLARSPCALQRSTPGFGLPLAASHVPLCVDRPWYRGWDVWELPSIPMCNIPSYSSLSLSSFAAAEKAPLIHIPSPRRNPPADTHLQTIITLPVSSPPPQSLFAV